MLPYNGILLVLVSIIINITAQVVECTAPTPGTVCILDCGGTDRCKQKTLTCRANDPCIIRCDAKSTCSSGTRINAYTATDVTVLCSGDNACKDEIIINCGTGHCELQCYGTFTTACENFGSIDISYSESFDCVGDCPDNIPAPFSPSPTLSPTISSASPTLTPTNNPTTYPTSAPTNNPTQSTLIPTNVPTSQPTSNPTNQPSVNPTTVPSVAPSMPSLNPSSNPTNQPTKYPTHHPTSQPTVHPTPAPTLNPTFDPTYKTTSSPTNQPSEAPTHNPTPAPTLMPTFDPTYNPTSSSTFGPTTNYTTESDDESGNVQDGVSITIIAILSIGICCISMSILRVLHLKNELSKQLKVFDAENKNANAMEISSKSNISASLNYTGTSSISENKYTPTILSTKLSSVKEEKEEEKQENGSTISDIENKENDDWKIEVINATFQSHSDVYSNKSGPCVNSNTAIQPTQIRRAISCNNYGYPPNCAYYYGTPAQQTAITMSPIQRSDVAYNMNAVCYKVNALSPYAHAMIMPRPPQMMKDKDNENVETSVEPTELSEISSSNDESDSDNTSGSNSIEMEGIITGKNNNNVIENVLIINV